MNFNYIEPKTVRRCMQVRRTWAERLLSLPWRPTQATKELCWYEVYLDWIKKPHGIFEKGVE